VLCPTCAVGKARLKLNPLYRPSTTFMMYCDWLKEMTPMDCPKCTTDAECDRAKTSAFDKGLHCALNERKMQEIWVIQDVPEGRRGLRYLKERPAPWGTLYIVRAPMGYLKGHSFDWIRHVHKTLKDSEGDLDKLVDNCDKSGGLCLPPKGPISRDSNWPSRKVAVPGHWKGCTSRVKVRLTRCSTCCCRKGETQPHSSVT